MQTDILAVGPPPLTEEAADAAIDTIDFIAAAVRGYDGIDVTDIVRPLWRLHLANWYPYLPPPSRLWFANAPQICEAITSQWPYLDPMQRMMWVQQWSMELPQMLAMIDPVLAQAEAMKMQKNQRAYLRQLREQAAASAPGEGYTEAQAVHELNRRSQQTASFINFSNTMANSTIDLMRAMRRR